MKEKHPLEVLAIKEYEKREQKKREAVEKTVEQKSK
jgi:hypothetical protein